MGAGYHGGFGHTDGEKTHQKNLETTKKSSISLVDKNIVSEMERNNIKFAKEDLIFTTKDKTGQLIFLEKGNSSAGLQHILDGNGDKEGHAEDFKRAVGISREEIPNYLHKVITHGTIIKEEVKTFGGKTGYERDYYYNGKYFVVTGIGTNGFLVSAYPKKYKGE